MTYSRRIDHHPYIQLPKLNGEVRFSFNGKTIIAKHGDTIASALHVAGVKILSRSFKYHRPRGLCDNQGLGPETLVTVDHAPNLCADRIAVQEGMQVRSQNAWPSVKFDMTRVLGSLISLLPNGFYYKMFHKPRWAWPYFEKMLRKAAGLGKIDTVGHEINQRYEKLYRFPDVCVIGAGPAGLAACLAALEEGKQTLLIEEDPQLGGHALHSIETVSNCLVPALNGQPAYQAVKRLVTKIRGHENLEILPATSVFALYEDNLVAAQRGPDHLKIRADSVVLATGATDRHLVFENNDLPGIMTGRGVERLIALHAIKPSGRAVIITNHDGGYHTAKLLEGAGTRVAAVVDARTESSQADWVKAIQDLQIAVILGKTIHSAEGNPAVSRVTLGDLSGKRRSQTLRCDLLVIAVGFKPQLQLLSMVGAKPEWDSDRQIYMVKELPTGVYACGEVHGYAPFVNLIQEGWETGKAAAKVAPQQKTVREPQYRIGALPADIESGGNHHFICKCMDVTRKEASLSIAEGFDQIETLKRFTSMGMGPCQGKSCYEAVARLTAIDTDLTESQVSPTTMRPPFRPVTLGVLAGRSHHLVPIRRTPMHDCHLQAGARFLNAGQWQRPYAYGDSKEEAKIARDGLGMIDVSTLGKFELSGPDALQLLHFMLPGKYRRLEVGRTRYSTMIGEDGILFEDGTISHLSEGRYYISTTTGNQDAIQSLFWWWITTEKFRVHLKNLGSVLTAVNISGQTSRAFLQDLVDIDLSNQAFPYMHCRDAKIELVPVMLFRIGFTGELSYEVHFPSEYGESMWNYLLERGKPYGLRPFGVEPQRILRLEKGHLIPGLDTDALSNPYEAGVDFTIKDDKPDFVGKAFLASFKNRGIENKLVTYKLRPQDPIPDDGVTILDQDGLIGRVTSSRFSPSLGLGIGLAWVKNDHANPGDQFRIRLANGQDVFGEVLDHAAYDPEGVRLKS